MSGTLEFHPRVPKLDDEIHGKLHHDWYPQGDAPGYDAAVNELTGVSRKPRCKKIGICISTRHVILTLTRRCPLTIVFLWRSFALSISFVLPADGSRRHCALQPLPLSHALPPNFDLSIPTQCSCTEFVRQQIAEILEEETGTDQTFHSSISS